MTSPNARPTPGAHGSVTFRRRLPQASDEIGDDWDSINDHLKATIAAIDELRTYAIDNAITSHLVACRLYQIKLRRAIANYRPEPTPGAHIGIAVYCEGVELPPDVTMPDLPPAELDTWYDDQVATGAARQFRCGIAVMRSGWRFQLIRSRHSDDVQFDVYEPGLERADELELAATVAELEARLAALP